MKQKVILDVISILFILLLLIFLAIGIVYKKVKEENQDQIFVSKKNARVRVIHAIYCFFNQLWITSYFVKKVKRKFEIFEPENQKQVEEDTMKTIGTVFIVSSLLVILGFYIDVSLYTIFCVGSFVYIVSSYTIYRKVNQKELLLMNQLKEILVELRHHYYEEDNIEASLDKTILDAKAPIDIHIQRIYETLISNDMDEEIQRYNLLAPNRFLKMLLSLCSQIKKFGDETISGQSLFIKDLVHLKEELETEIRKRELLNHKLAGLIWITILPMYTLKIYENWIISNIEGVEVYYYGKYGIIVSILLAFSSLFIYGLINRMKESEISEQKKHYILNYIYNNTFIYSLIKKLSHINYGKTLRYKKILRRTGKNFPVEYIYLRKVLYGITAFVVSILLTIGIHTTNRNVLLTNSSNLDSMLIEVPNSNVKEEVKQLILGLSVEYKDKPVNQKELYKKIDGKLKNPVIEEAVIKEIIDRTEAYKKTTIKWYTLFIVLGITALGYELPVILLSYENRMIKLAMQNEVVQFQSIILMLMYIKSISTKEILETMEEFASIFKDSISECLDEFASGEVVALNKLKEREEYPPFKKIIDNLIAADKVGILYACEEIEGDRKSSQEQRRQDNQIYIENKAAIGSVIAFIPSAIMILLYICIPIWAYGISQLTEYKSLMGNLM